MSAVDREALAEVLANALDVSDVHKAVPIQMDDRLANAILASDWLAQVKAAARAEALTEAECNRPHAGPACVPLGGCVGAHFTEMTDRLAAHEAREAELIAALEAGDACGAVGCRALAERDALLAQEARVRALADEYRTNALAEGYGGELWSTTEAALRNALDGPPA